MLGCAEIMQQETDMKTRIIRTGRKNGNGNIIFGTIMATLFGLATIGCAVSDKMDSVVPLIVCAALMILGISVIVKGVKYNRTVHVATDKPDFGEDTPEFVQDRIRELMQDGNTSNMTVSRTVKRVTYTKSDGTSHTTETTTETHNGGVPFNAGQAGNVTCPACGAVVKLRRGQSAVCEYCGSYIRG